jgi:hypothetical protein
MNNDKYCDMLQEGQLYRAIKDAINFDVKAGINKYDIAFLYEPTFGESMKENYIMMFIDKETKAQSHIVLDDYKPNIENFKIGRLSYAKFVSNMFHALNNNDDRRNYINGYKVKAVKKLAKFTELKKQNPNSDYGNFENRYKRRIKVSNNFLEKVVEFEKKEKEANEQEQKTAKA